ncbi:MAG: ATP-binding cassette domain-containing protein, partial [Bacilli bacterium]
MNNVIEIKGLSKKYYSKKNELVAIDNLSLTVNKGEYLAIVGPSGCGKSTLLNIIGGIDKKSSGEIIVSDGIRIGYMLQEDSLFPWLTILDNCLLGLKIKGELNKENILYVKNLLNTYGLGGFLDSYP